MSYYVKRANVDENSIKQVEKENGISYDLAEVLCMRGLKNSDDISKFLYPNIKDFTPWQEYDGMVEASERIKRAIDYGESIVIYGDYDCDGVCATSILYLFLSSLGVEVNFYIPHRKKEGYGINREALEEIAEKYAPDLIITVDCGISSHDDILYAMDDLGLEFIVTDHHEAPEVIPPCIVVDPKVKYKDNTFNELCGAGIALRLCEALGGTKALMYYLDIACLATIGDIVPLVSDNRIIVNYGLELINARCRMNIKLLLESAGIAPESKVTSTDIAFKIVPRINAIGRLSDPIKAVNLLIDSDYFYTKHLVEIATNYNTERQQFTDDLVEDALVLLEDYDLVNNRIIVLYSDKWEAGVLGIACSKLVGIFNRPCILLTYDGELYKGSCRSIEGINIYSCLEASKAFLNSYGGHKMACGVSVKKENMDAFIFAINEYARKFSNEVFLPHIEYDLERNINDIKLENIEQLNMLEPFGMKNPPVSIKFDDWDCDFNRITVTSHIKSKANDEFELVCFDSFSKMSVFNECKKVQVVSEIGTKIFNNRKYVQGNVKDVSYDTDFYHFDNEYLAIRYLYNSKYEDKSIFDIEYISEECIDKTIKNSLYGTCFIASRESTFNKYKDILKDKVHRYDIKILSEQNPLNRLVIDIDISQNLAYYDNIVFLDAPIKLGIIDYYKLNKNAKIYIVKDSICSDYIDLVKENFLDLSNMREYFVKVKEIIKNHCSLSNLKELFDQYKKANDNNVIKFYLAMFVFFELKIFRVKGCVIIYDKTIKTSLENSMIYTNIREVVNG